MNKKIQILRGIAIIAVIMIHTCPPGELGIIIRPFINFAVALFLFLSGYLTKTDDMNSKKIKKRILRVLIPYVLWSCFYSVPELGFNIMGIIKNLITTEACYIFYYIAVYIQLVLITPLILKVIKTKYKYIPFFIHFLWIFLIRYLFYGLNIVLDYPWNSYFCMAWMSYYYLGILLGNNIIKINFRLRNISLMYIVSIMLQLFEGFVWYYVFNNYELASSQVKISNIVSSSLFLIICYFYINNNEIKVKDNIFHNALIMIGNLSFGIYLVHPAVIRIINSLGLGVSIFKFPLNSILTLLISVIWLVIVNNVLDKKLSRYLGFS